jgi:hypothetical protein
VSAFGLALQVSFELDRLLNRPHQSQLGVRRESRFPDCHDALPS